MMYCSREERDFPELEFFQVGPSDTWLHKRPPIHTIDGDVLATSGGHTVHVPIPASPTLPAPGRLPVPNRLEVALKDFPLDVQNLLSGSQSPP